MRALAAARRAIVIPAFQTSGDLEAVIAGGKPAVLAALNAKTLTRFAPECVACHNATDYGRWAAAAGDALPYAINPTTGYDKNRKQPMFLEPASLIRLSRFPVPLTDTLHRRRHECS